MRTNPGEPEAARQAPASGRNPHAESIAEFITSTSLYNICNLVGEKRIGSGEVLFVLEDYATALTMALLVVLFAFLVRRHLAARI